MITSIDTSILYWIQETMNSPFMDTLWVFITHLGDKGIIWIALCLFLLINKKTRTYGCLMVLALAISTILINNGIKPVAMRSRPCWVNEVTLLIPNPSDYSFPSGHTQAGMVCSYILYQVSKKAGLVSYLMAILIGFSRLYLFVHYPSDVLVGALIGTLVAALVYYWYTHGKLKDYIDYGLEKLHLNYKES